MNSNAPGPVDAQGSRISLGLASATAPAQTASQAHVSGAALAATATDATTAPIELSPFEVRPEDVGYQAGNTTSGFRLNSRLKDTPAAMSTFTPEFLSEPRSYRLTTTAAF